MFEFYSHFLHGTYKFTQRNTCDFSTNFGALEHVLVVQTFGRRGSTGKIEKLGFLIPVNPKHA